MSTAVLQPLFGSLHSSLKSLSCTSCFVCMQPFGVLAIQLAHYHGVKVLATALSPDDQKFLEELRPSVGGYYSEALWRGRTAKIFFQWSVSLGRISSLDWLTASLEVLILEKLGMSCSEIPDKHQTNWNVRGWSERQSLVVISCSCCYL